MNCEVINVADKGIDLESTSEHLWDPRQLAKSKHLASRNVPDVNLEKISACLLSGPGGDINEFIDDITTLIYHYIKVSLCATIVQNPKFYFTVFFTSNEGTGEFLRLSKSIRTEYKPSWSLITEYKPSWSLRTEYKLSWSLIKNCCVQIHVSIAFMTIHFIS